MADTNYTQAGTASAEEDTGLFCRNCSPLTRKLGYWFTLAVGVIAYVLGIVNLISFSYTFLIAGSVIIIFSPLWIKSPCNLIKDLKNPIRITSLIIFLGCIVFAILCAINDWGSVIRIVSGVCLAVAGIWYFLSFFQNGQEACINCLKDCCKKKEGGSS